MSGKPRKARSATVCCGLSLSTVIVISVVLALSTFFAVLVVSQVSVVQNEFNSLISNRYPSQSGQTNLRTQPSVETVSVRSINTQSSDSTSSPPIIPLQPPPEHHSEEGLVDSGPPTDDPGPGSAHHEVHCPHSDLVTFWRPPTAADLSFTSPYASKATEEQYVTFEPDVGGWNNIRMQMEVVLVFALYTGRTLVLPPPLPMYLLNLGATKRPKTHSFQDFFPFQAIRKRMKVISMEEFLEKEGLPGRLSYSRHSLDLYCDKKHGPSNTNCRNKTDVTRVGEVLVPPLFEVNTNNNKKRDQDKKSQSKKKAETRTKIVIDGAEKSHRLSLWDYLRAIGGVPRWRSMTEIVAFPRDISRDKLSSDSERDKERLRVFAQNRTVHVYDSNWQREKVVHFVSKPGEELRLLEHFYTFLFFEDESADRFVKRFVRDYVHYRADILCRGAQIIQKMKEQSKGGKYVAFHIRRGEFQYKVVKLSASDLLKNLQPVLAEHRELSVYIATDEKNQSFFDPFKSYFKGKVHFLSDFSSLSSVHLNDLDPNYLGMLEQVVCMGSSLFVGTWFSTFSGYITRMRAYQGVYDPITTNFYGDREHRDRFQTERDAHFPFYMREWPASWEDIDRE